MKHLFTNMNTEDKAFFSITGAIGSMVEFERIMAAQVLNEGIFMVLFKAGMVAFISGFVGLIGKKSAQWIYHKLCGDTNPGD
jgi:hypothetical protein